MEVKKMNIKVLATTVPAILITFGSVGWLGNISGAGLLLFLGVILQVAWLAKFFI